MGTNTGIDILGWIGALLVILAYFMVSTRRVAGDALAYQLLNIAGAYSLSSIRCFPERIHLQA